MKPRRIETLIALCGAVLATQYFAFAQETTRVSVDSSGLQGDGPSDRPSISSDGQIVAFCSQASDLVLGDSNGVSDVFVHDRVTGLTERISIASLGIEANSASLEPAISADGTLIAFTSAASNLVSGDMNSLGDVFVHDRTTGITELISIDSQGVQGNSHSGLASISSDGHFIAFFSYASNLVAGDTNGAVDIFVRDRITGVGSAFEDSCAILDCRSFVKRTETWKAAQYTIDSKDPTIWAVVWPAPKSNDVPTRFQAESPEPIPGVSSASLGYPITFQLRSVHFQVTYDIALVLHLGGTSGAAVDCYTSTPYAPTNPNVPTRFAWCLMPKAPLKPGATYSVTGKVKTSDDDNRYEVEWSFACGK